MSKLQTTSGAGASTSERIRAIAGEPRPQWRQLIALQRLVGWRIVKNNKSILVCHILLWFYGLWGLLFAGLGCIGLHDDPQGHAAIIPGALGFATLFLWLLAITFPLGDAQVQPRQTPTLPLSMRDYLVATLCGSIIQSRGILVIVWTVVFSACVLVALPTLSASVVVAVVLGAIGTILITIVGMCFIPLIFGADHSAQKDKLAKYSVVIFLVVILAANIMLRLENPQNWIMEFGRFIQWTPLAAPAGIIAHTLHGSLMGALLCLLITVATVAVLIWFIAVALRHQIAEPLVRETAKERQSTVDSTVINPRALLLPGLQWRPWSIVGSVGVRSFVKDSRTASLVWMLPILAIFLAYMAYSTDNYMMSVIYTCFFALILASQSANVFGLDGPGTGLYLSSGVSSRALLLGRAFPLYLLEIVAVVLMSVASVLLFIVTGHSDDSTWFWFWASMTFGLGAALSSIGIGFLLSTYNPFAMSKPGTSPWGDRSGFKAAALVSSLISVFTGWVPLVPGIVCIVVQYNVEVGLWLRILGYVLAILVPLAVHVLFLNLGAKKYEQSGAEIYQKVKNWISA